LQDILTDNRPNSTCNFECVMRKMGKKNVKANVTRIGNILCNTNAGCVCKRYTWRERGKWVERKGGRERKLWRKITIERKITIVFISNTQTNPQKQTHMHAQQTHTKTPEVRIHFALRPNVSPCFFCIHNRPCYARRRDPF
jgi:hypothetical protein